MAAGRRDRSFLSLTPDCRQRTMSHHLHIALTEARIADFHRAAANARLIPRHARQDRARRRSPAAIARQVRSLKNSP